ncbi:hypothetical protein ABZ070_02255 [Streptomyces sp. NPDC006283]|uniref:hypothetical protein n=1 Tax=Streptomyces sp. NPDC006283 TaxID=3156741 RepID=UPI0033BD9A8B
MTEHRIGQWPVKNPVAVVPAPPVPSPQPEPVPLPEIDVRLTVTVDLTGRYTSAAEVSEHFHQQARRLQDCHTAVVRVGADAADHCTHLGQAIASAFYLSAERIEVDVPAGRWEGPFLLGEVVRHVRIYRAYHQNQWQTAQASG